MKNFSKKPIMDKIITINKFFGNYRFLSNFWEEMIVWNEKEWKSAEHAYQATKCALIDEAEKIAQCPTPLCAKRLGRVSKMRLDWDVVKDEKMKEILLAKFSNPMLKKKLLATGGIYLEEGNNWGDTYWGVCRGRGQNKLGLLLMEVREFYRTNP